MCTASIKSGARSSGGFISQPPPQKDLEPCRSIIRWAQRDCCANSAKKRRTGYCHERRGCYLAADQALSCFGERASAAVQYRPMCIQEEGDDDSDSAVAEIEERCALHSGKAEGPFRVRVRPIRAREKKKVASVWVSSVHNRVDVIDPLRCALRYFRGILLGINAG